MKVELLLENIEPYISLFSKTLPTRPQLPVLAGILLDASSEGLYLRATDLDLGVEVKIPSKIDGEGRVVVPGKEFLETLQNLPKDKIVLENEKDVLKLTCRGNTITFQTIPPDEFPILYKEKGDQIYSFTQSQFDDDFSYLTFSVSTEDSRPQLTGVYFNKTDEGFDIVATDGYRMSVKSISEGLEKLKSGLIIPVRLINEVMAIKSSEGISLYMSEKDNQVMFGVGEVLLVGRIIQGAFPNYRKVIPVSSKNTISFEREDFLQNVRLVSVFAKDQSSVIWVNANSEGLTFSAKNSGVGQGEVRMGAQIEGSGGRIAFNARFLQDFLKNVSEKSIVLKFSGSLEAALFDLPGKDFKHVIMPVQTEE